MYLRPDVHVARLDQDIVLLDAGGGEYLCLPGEALAFELSPTALPRIADPDLALDAGELGLLGDGQGEVLPLPTMAITEIPDESNQALAARDLFDGLGVLATLVAHYHRRSFASLLAHAARHRGKAVSSDVTPSHLACVHSFRRLLPWAPFQGVCLYRSFALLALLRRRGVDATWVFGVRTWPFEAHCWLQVGGVVLDDTVDHVHPFTPIMAI